MFDSYNATAVACAMVCCDVSEGRNAGCAAGGL